MREARERRGKAFRAPQGNGQMRKERERNNSKDSGPQVSKVVPHLISELVLLFYLFQFGLHFISAPAGHRDDP